MKNYHGSLRYKTFQAMLRGICSPEIILKILFHLTFKKENFDSFEKVLTFLASFEVKKKKPSLFYVHYKYSFITVMF